MNNTEKVIQCLKRGPMRQKDIVKATGVKNVYQIVADLVKKGVAQRNGVDVFLTNHVPAPPADSLLQRHVFSLYAEVSFLEHEIERLTNARTYLLSRISAANKKAERSPKQAS